jgi:hypothetical protein
MTQLRCPGCGHRFGKRAHTVLMFTDFVVCLPCSTSTQAHGKIFPGCALRDCTARAHSGYLTTIGRARQTIAEPWGRY